jgi:AcrR family transcriptional regulator
MAALTDTAPVGKRASHKLETRVAILRAAERLFAEQGFHATTMRTIADSAGVTERTLFRYFASKAELVADDLTEWLGFFEQALKEGDRRLPALVAIEQAIQRALDEPGPVAGWLFPSDPTGKPGPRPDGLRGVDRQIAEIFLRWRTKDAFRAAVLARVTVGIVRSAIGEATRRAALNGESVTIDDIRALISAGFALVAASSGVPERAGKPSPLSAFF